MEKKVLLLKLKRDQNDSHLQTTGRLYIPSGNIYYTIEPVSRKLHSGMSVEQIKSKKIAGKTAIPLGSYRVDIGWSNSWKCEMIKILDVKGFDGILIHAGNRVKDTRGCIIVGKEYSTEMLVKSYQALKEITAVIKEAISNKQLVLLEIS